jgi:hypothetical protein
VIHKEQLVRARNRASRSRCFQGTLGAITIGQLAANVRLVDLFFAQKGTKYGARERKESLHAERSLVRRYRFCEDSTLLVTWPNQLVQLSFYKEFLNQAGLYLVTKGEAPASALLAGLR